MNKTPKIIGLCGSAGAGKDTALTLLKLQLRTAGLAFADPMRAMIEALFWQAGIPRRYMQHRRCKEATIPALGVSYRHLAQTLGTEWGVRSVHADLWIRIAETKLQNLIKINLEAIAITDVRTAAEAAWVRKQGGLIWHIHRPQVTPVLAHITEAMPFLADRTVMNDPMHTIPTKDRLGLVMVHGEPWAIVDIGLRMLTPAELYRAQGFPASYIIDRGGAGEPITKTAQVRMCGNSVCPPLAQAIVAANYSEQQTAANRRMAA